MAKKVKVVAAVPLTTRRNGEHVVLPIGTELEMDADEATTKKAAGFVRDPDASAEDKVAKEQVTRKAAEEAAAKAAAEEATRTAAEEEAARKAADEEAARKAAEGQGKA